MGWGSEAGHEFFGFVVVNMSLLSRGGDCFKRFETEILRVRATFDPVNIFDCFSSFLTTDNCICLLLPLELNTATRVDPRWCRTSITLQCFKDSITLICFVTQLIGFSFSQPTVHIFHYYSQALLVILNINCKKLSLYVNIKSHNF